MLLCARGRRLTLRHRTTTRAWILTVTKTVLVAGHALSKVPRLAPLGGRALPHRCRPVAVSPPQGPVTDPQRVAAPRRPRVRVDRQCAAVEPTRSKTGVSALPVALVRMHTHTSVVPALDSVRSQWARQCGDGTLVASGMTLRSTRRRGLGCKNASCVNAVKMLECR